MIVVVTAGPQSSPTTTTVCSPISESVVLLALPSEFVFSLDEPAAQPTTFNDKTVVISNKIIFFFIEKSSHILISNKGNLAQEKKSGYRQRIIG